MNYLLCSDMFPTLLYLQRATLLFKGCSVYPAQIILCLQSRPPRGSMKENGLVSKFSTEQTRSPLQLPSLWLTPHPLQGLGLCWPLRHHHHYPHHCPHSTEHRTLPDIQVGSGINFIPTEGTRKLSKNNVSYLPISTNTSQMMLNSCRQTSIVPQLVFNHK